MRARLSSLFTIALLLDSAISAGESRPPYQGAAIGSLLGAPSTLDPVKARTHADVTLTALIFDTLYRIGADGEVEPHLAASLPEVAEDGRSARVLLRPGVEMHGRGVLSAEDVALSLRRARSGGVGWLLSPIRSVEAEEGAVRLSLRRPVPELASILSAPQTAITPEGKAPGRRHARGTGPFRLTGFRGRRITLERFERHFAGPPYLRRLDLRWFESADAEARSYESGDAHISFRGEVAFAGHKPKYRTEQIEGPAAVLVYVGFCRDRARLTGHSDFRRALSLALGRTGFRNVGTGERAVPSIHPAAHDLGGPRTPRRARRARVAEARRTLARVRRELGDLEGTELELLVDRSRPDDREVGGKVAAALYKLGLSARIVELDPERYARRVARGRCDLRIDQLAAPGPLPILQVAAAFDAGGDDWAQKRIATAQLSLREALEGFARRLPVLPLFHRAVRAHHRSNLRGVQFDGASRLRYADLFLFGPAEKL